MALSLSTLPSRIWRNPRCHSIWGISGDGQRVERWFLGVWFYQTITAQKWAPLATEYERERGIRIGHRRFGMTETVVKWHDGKLPATKRGRLH